MKRAACRWVALALALALLIPCGAFAGPGVGDEEEIPEFINPPKPKVVEEKPEPGAVTETPGETAADEEEEARILAPAEVLPEKCPFFAVIPRVSRLISGLRKTAVAEMVDEREIVDFVAKLRKRGALGPGGDENQPSVEKLIARSGFSVEKIEAIFSKQAAAAILPSTEGFRACAVFAVDEEAERAQEFVGRLAGEIKRAYPGTVDDSYWDGDIEVRTLDTQWGLLSFVSIENLLVVGYGKDAVDPVVAKYLAEGGKSFADNADFKKVYDELGKNSDFYFQLDLAEVLKAIPGALGDAKVDLAPVREVMGMQGVGLVAGASRVDRGGIRDTIVMYPAKGGGKFLPYAPRQKSDFRKIASYVPLNAIYFAAEHQDFSAAAAAAEQFSKSMADLGAMSMGGLKADRIAAVAAIMKDLNPAFGGQVAFAALRSPGQIRPEALAVIGVNDVQAATDIMKRIEAALDTKFLDAKYTEHDIRHCVAEKGGGVPLPLAYAFTSSAGDDLLLVGTSLDTLKKAIRQKRFGRTSVLQKDDFKRVTEGFAVERSAVAYLDLQQVVELIYSAALPAVGMAAQGGQLGFTAADLPATETITKHLFGIAWYTKVDDDKAEFQSYGPAGVVSAAVLGVGYAVPLVMDRYAKMAQEESKRKLTLIGMGLHLFASDNDRFPMSLSELYPVYVQDLNVFQAPRGSEIKSVDDIAAKGGYNYVPGRQISDLSDAVLVYEKRDVSPGGRHVLRLGMSVRFYKTRGFERIFRDLLELERKEKE